MYFAPHSSRFVRSALAAVAVISIFAVTSAFAQTRQYDVELVVSEGSKSVETDAMLYITADSMKVEPKKNSFRSQTKEFKFADIKAADYSYAKKPMLSGGGAVATALLVGFIFALPFLFIKKKKHWMTVQTGNEFAVMKLGGYNYRQIRAEFETHGVKVNEVTEEEKKNEDGK